MLCVALLAVKHGAFHRIRITVKRGTTEVKIVAFGPVSESVNAGAPGPWSARTYRPDPASRWPLNIGMSCCSPVTPPVG